MKSNKSKIDNKKKFLILNSVILVFIFVLFFYSFGKSDYEIIYEYVIVNFSTVGSHSWTVPSDVNSVQVLVVGGGGGGGSDHGGGGGGGGVVFVADYSVTPLSNINVVVGAGGNGAAQSRGAAAQAGGNSAFGSIVALGGGRGDGGAYASGGSGGGGRGYTGSIGYSTAGSATQPGSSSGGYGFNGGAGQGGGSCYTGGGGGGAGSIGQNYQGAKGGDGGVGRSYMNYFGTKYGENGYFGGGGGGCGSENYYCGGLYGTGGNGGGGNGQGQSIAGNDGSWTAPQHGQPNTGGGGGAAARYVGRNVAASPGGNGGSGIVLIKYYNKGYWRLQPGSHYRFQVYSTWVDGIYTKDFGIYYSSVWGQSDLFLPLKTSSEWMAFYNYHPGNITITGLSCEMAGSTDWGSNAYDCSASYKRCYGGVCRTCSGYMYDDGCSGCAGQGGNACWHKATNEDQSCNTICGSYGGCVAANWKDSAGCPVCDGLFPSNTGACNGGAGEDHYPWAQTDDGWGGSQTPVCYGLRTVDQNCASTGGNRVSRYCVCNY